jgi:hypothetical protein
MTTQRWRKDLGVFVVDNGDTQPFPGEHEWRAETFSHGPDASLAEAAYWFLQIDAYRRRHGDPNGARWICRLGGREP